MDNKAQAINKDLTEYVELIRKHHDIQGAYLFGSQSSGKANKYSDYDVAVVSAESKNRHEFLVSLLKLSRDFDLPIEPHPMTNEEFQDTQYLLGQEVRRYGITLM